MKEELATIQENKTWDLVDLLKGKKAIGIKWVFKTKFHANGSVEKHKVYLIAKGYSEQQGVDYEDTFFTIT